MRTHTKKCWCGSEHDTRWNPMSENPPPGGWLMAYIILLLVAIPFWILIWWVFPYLSIL